AASSLSRSPLDVPGEQVCSGAGVVALCQHGCEALVIRLHGNADRSTQALDERFGRDRLLTSRAAEGERHPDHDDLRCLRVDHGEELRKPVCCPNPQHRRERACERPRRVGDRDSGARGTEVERENLHPMAAASRSRPASSASRTAPTFLPPASASVGRPPPPPPMIGPSSRTIRTASSPASALSRFTTRATLPSSAEASTTACAASRCRSWSERSRRAPPRAPLISATNTLPCLSCHTMAGPVEGSF